MKESAYHLLLKWLIVSANLYQNCCRVPTKETLFAMRMLRDHAGYPQSICDHENMKDPIAKRDATNFGIIMDLSENWIYLSMR